MAINCYIFDKVILPASRRAMQKEINLFPILSLHAVRTELLRLLLPLVLWCPFFNLHVAASILILMETAKQNYLQRAMM